MAETSLPAAGGTYVLVFRARRPLAFRAGALGRVELPAGWLAYVGSAMGPGGLAARVGRHLAASGRPRWHVDHLVRRLPPAEVWASRTKTSREARWVRALATLPGMAPIAHGFGASDSSAASHLFHGRRRPALSAFAKALGARSPEEPPPRRYVAPPGAGPPLESLKNLGPASAAWLREAGIHTREQLARLGPVEAFLRVQQTGRQPSVNLLYAMAGALAGCRWDRLPEGTRGALLMELDAREADALEGPWDAR